MYPQDIRILSINASRTTQGAHLVDLTRVLSSIITGGPLGARAGSGLSHDQLPNSTLPEPTGARERHTVGSVRVRCPSPRARTVVNVKVGRIPSDFNTRMSL